MFTPGQRVVCINDRFHGSSIEWMDVVPRKGQVYTVTEVRPYVPDAVTKIPGPGLCLAEVPTYGNRSCFCIRRFRAIDDLSHTTENDEVETTPLDFTSETCPSLASCSS